MKKTVVVDIEYMRPTVGGRSRSRSRSRSRTGVNDDSELLDKDVSDVSDITDSAESAEITDIASTSDDESSTL